MFRRWTLWRIASLAPVAIAEAPEGKVTRVVGTVTDRAGALRSPLGGHACVYYRVVVSRPGSNAELGSDSSSVPFVVADGTGHAYVDTVGADVLAVLDSEAVVNGSAELTAAQAAFLEKRCFGNHRDEPLCFREWLIAVDGIVAVVGAGALEIDPDGFGEHSFRGASPSRLHFAEAIANRLVITNEPAAIARD